MTPDAPAGRPDRVVATGTDARPGPLAGSRIGVTAGRKVEEQVALLQRRGAEAVSAPVLVQQAPGTVEARLRAATEEVLARPVDVLVATTGIGVRAWFRSAAEQGLQDRLRDHLAEAEVLARGPKSVGALRALGLRERWSAESEELVDVVRHLEERDLHGLRVVLQEHGQPLDDVVAQLRGRGAEVVAVPVYRVVPTSDTAPVEALVAAVAERSVDAVTFTSAPAVEAFLDVARAAGQLAGVLDALRTDVLAACVGPVTAAALEEHDVPVSQPARSRLAAMVTQLEVDLPARRAARAARAAQGVQDTR